MKKTKKLYWIFTILFALSMIATAVPDIMMSTDAVAFMKGILGYPNYFTVFIGWAKIIGSIAILLPLPARLKEWAYAGLFFDLFGAVYSQLAAADFNPGIFIMLIWIILFILSYTYHHKLLREKGKEA